MKKIIAVLLSTALLASCATVAGTGRKQLMMVSPQEEEALGAQSFQEVLAKAKVITGTAAANQVKRVGQNLAAHVQENYQWQFALLQDNQVNAFCLPGGKVAVYSGILPVTQDDNGMAVVMGHEIAHALARHGAERMSQDYFKNLFGQLLGAATGSEWVMAAYGLGTGVAAMPFSRKQETEADYMGLVLMAKAGYDPRASVGFWQRMSAQTGGNSGGFLSTHPSDAQRIADLQKHMTEAMQYYTASTGKK